MSEARETIKRAIKERGVLRVYEASGVHFTRLYAFLKGSDLGPENAGKVRAVMPEIPDAMWLELCAPTPPAPDAPTPTPAPDPTPAP